MNAGRDASVKRKSQYKDSEAKKKPGNIWELPIGQHYLSSMQGS